LGENGFRRLLRGCRLPVAGSALNKRHHMFRMIPYAAPTTFLEFAASCQARKLSFFAPVFLGERFDDFLDF
jgi:hypothetical protein